MSDRHWSDDDLVARLFGLGPDDSHLDTCELCSRRWRMVRQRQEIRHSAETEVPVELLAAQRRAIHARLEQKRGKLRSGWLPLPAAALLILLVIFAVFRPSAQKHSTDVLADDEALQDVFTVASRAEPAGLEPVELLFEVQK